MITPIANKYATALARAVRQDFTDILPALQQMSLSFKHKKMSYILSAVHIKCDDNSDKVNDLLMGVASLKENSSVKKVLHNFLRILSAKKRLSLLPEIALALELKQSVQSGIYQGIVYSNDAIDPVHLQKLQVNISNKLAKEIKLVFKASDFAGVKVDIPLLNTQITFAKKQINQKLTQFILKSI